MEGLRWLVLLIVSTVWLNSIPEIEAAPRGCGSRLQLRSTEPHIDLSGLSPRQLQKLAQQLANLQAKSESKDEEEDYEEEEASQEQNDQAETELEEDNRGSSRPWNRVQRIIRRQLVKIPKRYLRKILRQFGLARSIDGVPQTELREYYVIPLE